ncbi:hypothetical protein AcV7_010273 [Taiwanofungus camphoratus]|nr:hypothetical protein AcV7_010273 [Antrodia cinnamomea]
MGRLSLSGLDHSLVFLLWAGFVIDFSSLSRTLDSPNLGEDQPQTRRERARGNMDVTRYAWTVPGER